MGSAFNQREDKCRHRIKYIVTIQGSQLELTGKVVRVTNSIHDDEIIYEVELDESLKLIDFLNNIFQVFRLID